MNTVLAHQAEWMAKQEQEAILAGKGTVHPSPQLLQPPIEANTARRMKCMQTLQAMQAQ